MKLLISATSEQKVEELLNKHYYSSTYKIVDDKILYGNPLKENTDLIYKIKKQRHLIYIKN